MADEALAVKITVSGIPSGGFFDKLKLFFNRELTKAETEIRKRLLHDAREKHNYTHRSRNLRNATRTKGRLTGKNGLELYVDLGKARYAGFIITGERDDPRYGNVYVKTGPDPFIDDAIENNIDWINERIQKAIDTAVVTFNRTK